MTTQTVNDWVLGIGFDLSEAEKVPQKINKILAKIRNTRVKVQLDVDESKAMRRAAGRRSSYGGYTSDADKAKLKAEQFAESVRKIRIDLEDFARASRSKLGETSSGFQSLTLKIKAMNAALKQADSQIELRRIRTDLVSAKRAAEQYGREQRKLNAEWKAGKFAASGMVGSLKNLARAYLSVFAVISGAAMVGRASMELDSIKSSMLAASGSAEQAAKDFDFVRGVVRELGTDLRVGSKGFSQLNLAAQQAGMSSEDAKEMFLAASEASIAFGLSAEDQSGVIRAMVQMLSKGTVMAEELRGQMGDRMPIAINTMAKAMGVSTQQLSKMMEQGQLISKDVLPKFSKELRNAARSGNALQAGQNTIGAALGRMKLAWLEFVEAFSESGGKGGIVSILDSISDMLKKLIPIAKVLGQIMNVLGKAIDLVISQLKPESFGMIGIARDIYSKSQEQKVGTSPPSVVKSTKQNNSYNVTMNITSNASDPAEVGRAVDQRLQRVLRGAAAPTN